MAVQQDHLKYGQYNPQGLMRSTFGMFTDAGLNLFNSGPNQSPSDWLDLTNLLPATSGGLRRRWGVQTQYTDSTAAFNAVRMFSYNVAPNAVLGIDQEDLIIT